MRKISSRLCLLAAGAGLLAALILAPRQGLMQAELDLLWDAKLQQSVEAVQQAEQDGFYLVQRGTKLYLAVRGYEKAYTSPDWKFQGSVLTLSADSRPSAGSGLQLYRVETGKNLVDTIRVEENGQETFMQCVLCN